MSGITAINPDNAATRASGAPARRALGTCWSNAAIECHTACWSP